ncbi:MAG: pilus assembly protein TadG-related protein [Pseudorhodoplanes sp.]
MSFHSWFTRLRRFTSASTGNVAIIFGLAILPIFATAGAAIDFSRGYQIKNQLQNAADAAALAATRNYGKSWAERQQIAQASFNANLSDLPSGLNVKFSIIDKGQSHHVDASALMPTSFVGLIGYPDLPIAVDADAISPNAKLEVVLVLDNTGSMSSQNKIGVLRQAARNFVDMMETAAAIPGKQVKIGLVPFTTMVRLDTATYKTASWMNFGGNNPNNWTGCIWDRNQPYDTNDTAPTSTQRKFEPHGTAGWPPAYWWLSNTCTIAKIEPLTTNFAKLRQRIDDMNANGNTNVTLGVAWGLHLLSDSEPMTQGAPFSDAETTKVLVVLTDGDNTESRFSTNQNTIDNRTRLACNSAKSSGIDEIYTVRVIEGNESLLRDCATDPANYKSISNATELTNLFKQLAVDIINKHLRLTS